MAAVDGVAFAVPPDVQAPIATAAAQAGKHLLLEKPLAISAAEADELAEAVTQSQVGALWDIAPHVISLLWAGLGPVTSVTADAGPADVSHLILHHQGGPTSTVTVSQSAGEEAAGFEAFVWGGSGRSVAPAAANDPLPALRTALGRVREEARSRDGSSA